MTFAPKFERFSILAPDYDPATHRAVFHYAFDDELRFEEIWEFDPEGRGFRDPANPDTLRVILAHMAIALAPSYYKLSPTPRIVSEHLAISPAAKEFWKKFFTLGLGEYLYRNDIDPSFVGEFESNQGSQTLQSRIAFASSDRALVPMGGGKDSIVTVEAIRALGLEAEIVTIGRQPNPLHLSVIERTGYPHRFMRRTVDPRMIELAKSGDWPN
jgi:UDP-N-acetyl-alpha-D-muramoyl-L-alanyl-L-glutamate epimerase